MSSLSAQSGTTEEGFHFQKLKTVQQPILRVEFQNYKTLIKPAAMRRMSKAVKMGVFTAVSTLLDSKIEEPTAIITGTGMGCKQDSDIFLENLLQEKETLVSPSKFIQSTHNTVGGQIALYLKSKAYNFTYVQGSASFESALLDAQLTIGTVENKHQILVGGIDEISEKTLHLLQLDQQVKKEGTVENLKLLQYNSPGSIVGEGAHFFLISNEQQENTYAKILDTKICNSIHLDDVEKCTLQFLKTNNLIPEAIDAVVLGNNGDSFYDTYFKKLQDGIFVEKSQFYYKHLVGESYTASAFGLQLAAKILKSQTLPKAYQLNNLQPKEKIKKVLLYNQLRGKNHSWILVEHV